MIFDIAKTNVPEIRETERSDGYGLRVKREQLQLGTATGIAATCTKTKKQKKNKKKNKLILDLRFDLGNGLARLLGLRFEYL